ncbi:MAG TPA: hypothetical protein VIJ07_08170 [Dermatophilaceae bacterium]
MTDDSPPMRSGRAYGDRYVDGGAGSRLEGFVAVPSSLWLPRHVPATQVKRSGMGEHGRRWQDQGSCPAALKQRVGMIARDPYAWPRPSEPRAVQDTCRNAEFGRPGKGERLAGEFVGDLVHA